MDNVYGQGGGPIILQLTAEEALAGCVKEVMLGNQRYHITIPAGTPAGSSFELRADNGFLLGTVAVQVTGSMNTAYTALQPDRMHSRRRVHLFPRRRTHLTQLRKAHLILRLRIYLIRLRRVLQPVRSITTTRKERMGFPALLIQSQRKRARRQACGLLWASSRS